MNSRKIRAATSRSVEHITGPMHNLVVFEAAARHLSFSRAADELSVTQPAVSQAIRRLEHSIGVQLFLRDYKRLRLSEAGAKLAKSTSCGFSLIVESVRQIARESAENRVELLVSTAFATWWLLPRLPDLRALHPEIVLKLHTVTADIDITDVNTTLAVRRGNGRWPGYNAIKIADEELIPAASPSFLSAFGPILTLPDLARAPRIHFDEPERNPPGWSYFFGQLASPEIRSEKYLRLNDYALVLQAAMAGEGIVLGWRHLLDRPLKLGLLKPIGSWHVKTNQGVYLLSSENARLSSDAERVLHWFRSQLEDS